jgi:hypothetical protein
MSARVGFQIKHDSTATRRTELVDVVGRGGRLGGSRSTDEEGRLRFLRNSIVLLTSEVS